MLLRLQVWFMQHPAFLALSRQKHAGHPPPHALSALFPSFVLLNQNSTVGIYTDPIPLPKSTTALCAGLRVRRSACAPGVGRLAKMKIGAACKKCGREPLVSDSYKSASLRLEAQIPINSRPKSDPTSLCDGPLQAARKARGKRVHHIGRSNMGCL